MKADCHMHMILDGYDWRQAIHRHDPVPDEGFIHRMLAIWQEKGFTYLRDGGDAWGVGRFASKLASEYGVEYRTPVFPIHRNGRYGGFIGKGFDTMAEYRNLVQEAGTQGADFIKIMISGLMDFDRYGVITSQPLTPAEIREMISVAHGEGFKVMAHANGADTVKAAIDAGVDSIEHGAYLDASAVDMLAHSGCIWCPTLVTIANLVGDGRFPDEVLVPLRDLHMRNIAECVRQGGKIAPGSDNGAYRVPHVQGTMDEYMHLKKAIGENTDAVLEAGLLETRCRFVRE